MQYMQQNGREREGEGERERGKDVLPLLLQ